MFTRIHRQCKFCEEGFSYFPSRHGQGNAMGGRVRKREVCDTCRGDKRRVDRIKKHGVHAKDWPAAHEMPQHIAKQDIQYYIFDGLQIIQPNPQRGITGSHWEQAWPMADHECEHGRMQGDSCPSPVVKYTSFLAKGQTVQTWPHDHPCGCWDE